MKNYQKRNNLAIIPLYYLENQQKLGLSADEVLTIIKIEINEDPVNDLNQFLSNQQISIQTVKNLQTKGILTVSQSENGISFEVKEVKSDTKVSSQLNRQSIDRISFLLNRKLQMHELEKINKWLTLDYTINQIETAISKSMINDVDNINYIEKVLFNGEGKQQQNLNIERNFDLY